MIFDRLSNAALYIPPSGRIARAFAYLQTENLEKLPVSRGEIDGTQLYALVQEYATKPHEEGKWEAHRRYIDLQYIVRGVEECGVARLDRLNAGAYDPQRDFLPLEGSGDILTLRAGEFVLFFPEDAHMPGLAAGAAAPVRKIVVKIAVE
jgi:YhcH/YjgK/YiaL family protein